MSDIFSPELWKGIQWYGDLLENFDEGKNFYDFVDKIKEAGIKIDHADQYRLIFILTYLKHGAKGFYLTHEFKPNTNTYRYRFGIYKFQDKPEGIEYWMSPLTRTPQELELDKAVASALAEDDPFYHSPLAMKIFKEVSDLQK